MDPELADRVLEHKLRLEETAGDKDRSLRLWWDTTAGTYQLSARLPKLVGERLKLALEPLAAPQTGPDGFDQRTAEHRNVDALDELVQRALANELVPSNGGNPTQLVITLTRTGGQTLPTGIDLSRKQVDQVMCEAAKVFLFKSEDAPGRVSLYDDQRQRRFLHRMRRLLELRDQGCAFPGRDRAPGWCHAHHIVPWAKGGPTTRDNGVLLCGYHHRLIHQGEWTVRLARDGYPEFVPPDWIDPSRRPLRNTRLTPAA